jgi:hypothetical protein
MPFLPPVRTPFSWSWVLVWWPSRCQYGHYHWLVWPCCQVSNVEICFWIPNCVNFSFPRYHVKSDSWYLVSYRVVLGSSFQPWEFQYQLWPKFLCLCMLSSCGLKSVSTPLIYYGPHPPVLCFSLSQEELLLTGLGLADIASALLDILHLVEEGAVIIWAELTELQEIASEFLQSGTLGTYLF